MQQVKRYSIKNILLATLWIAIGSAAVILLVAAVKKKDAKLCRGIEISISGVSTNFFIDKNDVLKIIASHTGSTTLRRGRRDGSTVGAGLRGRAVRRRTASACQQPDRQRPAAHGRIREGR